MRYTSSACDLSAQDITHSSFAPIITGTEETVEIKGQEIDAKTLESFDVDALQQDWEEKSLAIKGFGVALVHQLIAIFQMKAVWKIGCMNAYGTATPCCESCDKPEDMQRVSWICLASHSRMCHLN